ncbi:MAG TPA: pitrilysin family protein [Terriglobia bacterium]|nr:pitrilysin family protein [Terriglobia bacterium]
MAGASGLSAAASRGRWHSQVLSNGLRIFALQDASINTATVYVTYFVGAVEDPHGLCGDAHLLEHMMFRGSPNVASGEFAFWIREVGGELQGSTGLDRSVFYETIPSTDLELALYLEADRMRSLQLSPGAFINERRVVVSEAEGRADSETEQIRNVAWAALTHTQQDTCPAVGLPVAIRRLTINDVRELYQRYYCPRDAVVIIVGNAEPSRMIKLATKYFDGIPSSRECWRSKTHEAPTEKAPNTPVIVIRSNGRSSGIYLCFNLGSPFTKRWYSMFLFGRLFGEGTDSFLHKLLVQGGNWAGPVQFSVEPREGGAIGSIFVGGVVSNQLDRLAERVVYALRVAADTSIDEGSLKRMKRLTQAELTAEWITSQGKANMLSQAITLYRRDYRLDGAIKLLREVTAADVKSTAKSMVAESPIIISEDSK